MAEPSNEDAARALDRMTSPEAPTPQPKPRTIAKPMPLRPGTPNAAPTGVRPGAPKPKPTPAPPRPDLQEALAGNHLRPAGAPKPTAAKSDAGAFALQLKRTLIPILLTAGFILVSLAAVHFLWKSDDNPVIELPTSVTVLMCIAGLLSWGLAVMNMVSVRRTLLTRS